MLNKIKYKSLLLLTSVLLLAGCSDLLDIKSEEVLEAEDMYQNKYDAEVALRGIYGQFIELAEQIVVLNELRADLMDVTDNANQDLRDLNEHNVSAGNVYADPLPMYKVINNCNDALYHYKLMLKAKTLLEDDFIRLYSEVASIRSYVYLQLAIHFGTIPYVTEPIDDYKDIADSSNFTKLTLPEVVSELVNFMESEIDSTDLYITLEQFEDETQDVSNTIFINKRFLMGDLYLWNDEYLKAATVYKELLTSFEPNNYDRYKITWADVLNHDDLNVGYIRYRGDDVLSLVTDADKGWRSIFTRTSGTKYEDEWIWAIPYENRYESTNPFIDLFANQGEGEYLVKPSELVINDYWGSQVQSNLIPWDARSDLSWQEIDGQKVITKFIENYDPSDQYNRTGYWYINRAALLNLRFSEAANRDGHSRIAYALLNHGISTEYDSIGALDITYLQRTNLPWPYDFDARMDGTGQIPVGVRGPWHRNTGVRGRANLQTRILGEGVDSVAVLEEQLIEEAALELAFEGHRWGDLVRIALRTNNPSFLADKVANKLSEAGNGRAEEVRTLLATPENWYLKMNLE